MPPGGWQAEALSGHGLLLLCLDRAHSCKIQDLANPMILVASCPLQVKRYLKLHPRQLVILDRCPGALTWLVCSAPALVT